MMTPWRLRLLLALLSTLLLLADDFLQQLYTASNHAELEGAYVATMFAVSLALWCSGRRLFVLPVLALFAGMQLLQLAHISYIGQPLSPVDISRLYSEWGEVSSVLDVAVADHWPVLLAWGLPYGALFWLFSRFLPRTGTRWPGIAMLLVLAALGSKPQRALKFDMIHFMPGPTRSSLHNSLNAFSYYLTRMSFGRDTVKRPDYTPYTVTPLTGAAQPDRLWVVLGESVRSDRLSVYGYARDTTPRLRALQRAGRLAVVPGQAAAVATGATIPLFLNGADEPGNIGEIQRKTANLFRLAQASGYQTFWVSAQESKLMSEVGAQWLNLSRTREDAPLDYASRGDRALLTQLEAVTSLPRSFGIIHTRATHIPYEDAYAREPDFVRPWPDAATLPPDIRRSNQYDNALRYFDALVAELMARAEKLPGRTWIVVTSDHGQMLGEHGRWGHNVLTPEVAAVPMLLFSSDGAARWPAERVFSHNQLHGWLAAQLGWQVNNPNRQPGVSWFHGNNPYGDNLVVRLPERHPNKAWTSPVLISHLSH